MWWLIGIASWVVAIWLLVLVFGGGPALADEIEGTGEPTRV